MDTYKTFIKMILPSYLVDYFDLVKTENNQEELHLYFEEINSPPKIESQSILVSKGFHKEITIQDFPLRGNTVYLHVKRRRWIDKQSKSIIQRDWKLVAQGTRMTQEFASFLKEINRY